MTARRIAIFLRHGDYHQLPHTPSAHQPFSLTPDGEEQARKAVGLIDGMAQEHDWHIYPVIQSSNLLRAWQTADIIGQGLEGIDRIEGDDALAERGLGSAANLTIAQVEDILRDDPRFDAPPKDWKSNSLYRLPLQGAESLMQAGERVAEYVRSHMVGLALGANAERNIAVLFVGHGAAFRHAAYVLGTLAFDDIAKLSMHHATPVALEVSAENAWSHAAGAWKVRALKDRNLD